MCLIKRLLCKHEYQLVSKYRKDVDDSVGYRLADIFVLYCPKCKKQKEVLKYQYEAIMNRQKLDKEYNKNDNERT